MRFLEALVETRLAEAVGWTILHSLWEGAVVAAALGAALLALRSPRARYAAGCAALLLLVAAFGVTLVRVMPEAEGRELAARIYSASASKILPDAAAIDDATGGLAAVVPWLAPLWVAGVSISYLWFAAGWMSLRRLRKRGVCCVPQRWQKELERLKAQLGLTRPVQLLESALADVPMVLGHFRPLILMPIGLIARLPEGQIEAILLHELAHIRRHDYLINIVQRCVEGLLFYHPALWWMSDVMRTERENCCDDVVVAMNGNAHQYAVALAALEQERWGGSEPAVAATGGSLMKRIRRLLYPKKSHGAWTPLFAVAALVVCSAAVLAAWQATPVASASASKVEMEKAAAGQDRKSLFELGAYLATEEERAAFEALTSEQARKDFVEQFWLRRDPTPGNAENEFRKEHYRRIEYAGKRFATQSGGPGWQTDRGRIYVIYGPPDEIEAHPSGTARSPYAFQVWMYHYVEGLGNNVRLTFIDRLQSGDYEIAPGSPQ